MSEIVTPSVPSPCTGICRLDAATGWCEGCHRTRDEIASWRKLDDEGRRAVLARLDARRPRAAAAASVTEGD
ncbi:DUF1289 domain-containing protein [Burkholderia sp. FERM BP-3421]|jgi:predicted Fe-S protein YdhL (DUF1289 family)|nr:DUF1289 domain-containing protein [Burkholderia sp. FERM BP-3421]WDD95549.1 DUF1289 domain-containing protein [Burkholderia sp. FERM BP-3421]